MERRAFRAVGRVQGVGFRAWAARRAGELRLRGRVRNEADGSVSVVAEGDPADLDRLADLLRQGPPFARVDRVERLPAPDGLLPERFEITG